LCITNTTLTPHAKDIKEEQEIESVARS